MHPHRDGGDSRPPSRRQPTSWQSVALACALVGVCLPVVMRVACPRGADIHVEWRPSVDDAARRQLEARFALAGPQKLEPAYTWRYDLRNTSGSNIRALVTDPAVEDTHEIDRTIFALEPTAPRTGRRDLLTVAGDAVVSAADGLGFLLVAVALLGFFSRTSPLHLLQRGIPELNAETAGLFRIAFGVVVLVYFSVFRVDASWLNATFDLEIEGRLHEGITQWLRARPWFVNLLTPWVLTTGVAFTIGLFTRATYALFAAGVLLWAFVAMSIASTHPHSPLVLAIVALLPSRWGDALSIDAWRGKERGPGQTSGRVYGYSIWVPGLVFGIAFAAAAWAKLTVPPGWTDWVLNGTVKYHFITDSVNAPVAWGLQLARYPLLAILASLAAVTTEALVITAAFTRSEGYRLALGVAAAALLAGFELFMGVFWPGWWILLLGFLPWRTLGTVLTTARRSPTPEPSGLRFASAAQLATIIVIVVQQIAVSAAAIERAPMFSWYDMYSATYSSPAAWNDSRPPQYRIVVSTDRGPVELPCNPHGEFVREFEAALDGSSQARANVWRALRGCNTDLTGASQVQFEGDRQVFDWDRLVFTTTRSVQVLGPLPADEHAATAN